MRSKPRRSTTNQAAARRTKPQHDEPNWAPNRRQQKFYAEVSRRLKIDYQPYSSYDPSPPGWTKGGTGKTSLCFQSMTFFAHQNLDMRVLAIDVCPQANLSELLFGGLTGKGSEVLLARRNEPTRRTIGGYFELRLRNAFSVPAIDPDVYISHPADYNSAVPDNLDLIAGDPILELQATPYPRWPTPSSRTPPPGCGSSTGSGIW